MAGLLVTALPAWNGCAIRTISPEARKVQNETFESVYTVGSHIPRRVRKGATYQSDDGSSPVAVEQGDEAKESINELGRLPGPN